MPYYNFTNLTTYDLGDQGIALNNLTGGYLGFMLLIVVVLIFYLGLSRRYNSESSIVAALWAGTFTAYFLVIMGWLTSDWLVIFIIFTAIGTAAALATSRNN